MKNNICPRCGLKDVEPPRPTSTSVNRSMRSRDKMVCPKCNFKWFPKYTPEENFYRHEKQRLTNFYSNETPTWSLNMSNNSWTPLNPKEKLERINEKLPSQPS